MGPRYLRTSSALDHRFLRLPFRNLLRDGPADRRNLTLQVPYPGLPRVGADDYLERLFLEFDEFGREPVLAKLLRNEELPGDHDLFFFRVAGQLQDLHPVFQGRRYGVEDIRRGNKHHLGQVKRHFQVVVAEGPVLFGVEDLQECARRIAPEVHADLVDFIEHEDGVVRPCLFYPLDHPAGQGAHIRPAVAPDLGLVTDAPEGYPHELPSEGPGDRLPQGRLSHSGRPDKAEYRPPHIRLQLPDRQVFEYPLLHLFKVVVVFVEDPPRVLDIEVVFRRIRPRQIHEPVEVGPCHRVLGRHAAHLR